MKKKLKNIIESSRGFTLLEMLLAVLILLMVSGIVAAGVPAAKNAYEKVVLSSNAEVLLSTAVSSLRNELGTATAITPGDVSESNYTSLTYFNETRGATSKIFLNTSNPKCIMLQRYVKSALFDIGANSTPERLVTKKASTEDLYVTYDSVTYSGGIITFHNLSVNRESGRTGLAVRENLSIRVIADPHSA